VPEFLLGSIVTLGILYVGMLIGEQLKPRKK
jgi:hypothetical protein